MSTSSVAVEHKKYSDRIHSEDKKIAGKKTVKPPPENSPFAFIKRKIYYQVVETFKSILLVFLWLLLYKITGLHELWTMLINRMV